MKISASVLNCYRSIKFSFFCITRTASCKSFLFRRRNDRALLFNSCSRFCHTNSTQTTSFKLQVLLLAGLNYPSTSKLVKINLIICHLSTMPNISQPTGQDWGVVNVGRASTNRSTVPQTAQGLARAKAMGLVSTERKFAAGTNASAHNASVNARKIEESEELKHAKVDKALSKAIMEARMAKKMTQKDLATKINEKPQVVGEYESGKAIPNAQIIVKMEKVLGVKLPRPGKKPAAAKTATAGAVKPGLVSGGPPKRR